MPTASLSTSASTYQTRVQALGPAVAIVAAVVLLGSLDPACLWGVGGLPATKVMSCARASAPVRRCRLGGRRQGSVDCNPAPDSLCKGLIPISLLKTRNYSFVDVHMQIAQLLP